MHSGFSLCSRNLRLEMYSNTTDIYPVLKKEPTDIYPTHSTAENLRRYLTSPSYLAPIHDKESGHLPQKANHQRHSPEYDVRADTMKILSANVS